VDDDPRAIKRKEQRKAGDQSARIARELMKLGDAEVAKLTLEEDLREKVERARAVSSHNARRRAERTLAGDLRRFELDEVEAELTRLEEMDAGDARRFQASERWRAQLLEGADPATFPNGDAELPRLIDAAKRERDTGKPPGAARALFRYIAARL
jgi:ribosome-associated protein